MEILLLFLALVLYLLPTIIAYNKGHPFLIQIAIVNIFFGWTLVVYVGCAVVATLDFK